MVAKQLARRSIWGALLVGMLNISATYGVNKTWDGSDNGNWHDGDNWSPTCRGGPICALLPPAPNAPSAFFTHQFHVSNGGRISLGGLASPGAEVEIGEPGSTISAGAMLDGNGTIRFDNFGGGPTTDVLQIDMATSTVTTFC